MLTVKYTCIIIFLGNGDLVLLKKSKILVCFFMKNTMTMLLSAKA